MLSKSRVEQLQKMKERIQKLENANFGYLPLGEVTAKPIHEGNRYASCFTCPNCDFPKNDTLTTDMKYCFNCGAKLDWSDFA